MGSIIIAMPKIEDAKKISELICRYGYETTAICTNSTSVLTKASELDQGVVITVKRMSDMYYSQIAEYLPDFFEMLLLTKAPEIEGCPPNVITVGMPLRAAELVEVLGAMLTRLNHRYKKTRTGHKTRSPQDQKYIDDAKAFIMEKNDMTEQEAFRYIQKTSMDSGTNMVECAQMILMMK